MKRPWSEIAGVDHRIGRVHADHRGGFTKHLDQPDDPMEVTQVATARNTRAGTVRGLHFQARPDGETKRLWVATGALVDILVDVRVDSATYGDWTSVALGADEPAVLTVPPGVAHGYQTLDDDTTVVYLITGAFVPESARTLFWRDATVGVDWPRDVTAISDSDEAGQPWPVTF